jgi:hypothetical protein
MLDRQKLEAILSRRFPGSRHDQLATAANAIMGLDDEWEEIDDAPTQFDCRFAARCADACFLMKEADHGTSWRLFRRRQL